MYILFFFFFFQAEDCIRDATVTGVQTCALPIWALGVGGPTPVHHAVGDVGRIRIPLPQGRVSGRDDVDVTAVDEHRGVAGPRAGDDVGPAGLSLVNFHVETEVSTVGLGQGSGGGLV